MAKELYRIFVYDPCREQDHGVEGAVFAVGGGVDIEARSESEALELYKLRSSRAMRDDGVDVKFFARSHRERERWPNANTGRMSGDDLLALKHAMGGATSVR